MECTVSVGTTRSRQLPESLAPCYRLRYGRRLGMKVIDEISIDRGRHDLARACRPIRGSANRPEA